MERLPLFPLGTVLFPGERLPLQLFEPRYLQLVADMSERPQDERVFGVVALVRGHEVDPARTKMLATTGTVVQIESMTRRPGGPAGFVVDIETIGMQRFRLHSFDADRTPYFCGDVERLPEATAEPLALAARAQEVRDAYRSLAAALTGVPRDLQAADTGLAQAVAGVLPLPMEDRQAVLATDDPQARLDLVAALLRRESVLAGRMRLLPAPHQRFGPPSAN